MKVFCVFTLQLPHRGDSNEYTQYTIFQYEKEKHPKLYQICSCRIFFKELKNEFDKAVVNEPSMFEPFKFCCIYVEDKTSADFVSGFLKEERCVCSWSAWHPRLEQTITKQLC